MPGNRGADLAFHAIVPVAPGVVRRPELELFMERIANLHIEKLPEGVYVATSEDIPGLVAQGRTITETLEIARDVAKRLLEARSERDQQADLTVAEDSFDYPLILGG